MQIRLLGTKEECSKFVHILGFINSLEVNQQSREYSNHNSNYVRVYLSVDFKSNFTTISNVSLDTTVSNKK